MKKLLLFFILICVFSYSTAETKITSKNVALIHGLARSSESFEKMQQQLADKGYTICNVSYPSTEHSIEILTIKHVLPKIQKCFGENSHEPISFVTHSLGGIIVRMLAEKNPGFNFGRVVMLSPPNQGSEVVDNLGDWWLFNKINGPAGSELGTDENSIPNQLGPAPFEVGIITGNQSINLMLSTIIPGEDDGKVSIESAKLTGMTDYIIIPATHTFIMKNELAIEQSLNFLEQGYFIKNDVLNTD